MGKPGRIVLLGCLLAACGDGGAGPDAGVIDAGAAAPDASAPDPSAPLFAPERLLVVEIELAPGDWDALRVQHHDLFDRFVDSCPGPLPTDIYTVYPATVTIDGETFTRVGVRKKGFLGSVTRTRPSLKLSFDEYDAGREVYGLERMTLNNNQQDSSQLDTCLTYQVFRAAGVPAPRCNWARVIVNGEDLGTFSHVESVRRRLLGRHFADSSGNLYEGQIADLRPVWVDNYEDKPGNDGDRGDLGALVDALAAGDDTLLDELDAVLDVDAFLSFWAAEVLVGHWDGYTGNRNNHYLYRDPTTGRFHFLPWGPDSAFGDPNPFIAFTPPPSVWANSALSRRLYLGAETRARYQARMAELLDQAWDEPALLAEIDRVEAMLAPHTHVPAVAFAAGVDAHRSFVSARRGLVEASLDEDPGWDATLPDSYCLARIGTATGTFAAEVADFPPANILGGTGTLDLVLGDAPISFAAVSGAAGPDNDPSHPRLAATALGFLAGGNGRALIPLMLVEPEVWGPGTVAVDGYDVFGTLVDFTPPAQIQNLGFMRGTVTFDAAPTTPGETASGSFDLEIYGPAPP